MEIDLTILLFGQTHIAYTYDIDLASADIVGGRRRLRFWPVSDMTSGSLLGRRRADVYSLPSTG